MGLEFCVSGVHLETEIGAFVAGSCRGLGLTEAAAPSLRVQVVLRVYGLGCRDKGLATPIPKTATNTRKP